MLRRQVIVIGAGPAGLMAAGTAAEMGASVLLLEKMQYPGLKLRLTGKGRCNLTNTAPLPDFLAHFGPGGKFLNQAFSRFFSSDLIAFMKKLGVRTLTEADGRIFPASGEADEVADALVRWVVKSGVTLLTESPVKRLVVEGGKVVGVEVSCSSSHRGKVTSPFYQSKGNYRADAVILACGGSSYPNTGSTGDGYRLAESVGHTILPVRPALVPVETAGDIAPKLQGVSLRDVKVRVLIDKKKQAEKTGELIFTHFGLSGPMILDLSRMIVDALFQNHNVIVSIDLIPDLDEQRTNELLQKRLIESGKQKIKTILREFLPNKLVLVCLDSNEIPLDRVGHQVTVAERNRLRSWLKNLEMEVTGFRSYSEAMVTAGGVNTKEVDPRTMESRLIRGLYFAGEVLDIDADTGGYNLQAAFSTGWMAGHAAVQ